MHPTTLDYGLTARSSDNIEAGYESLRQNEIRLFNTFRWSDELVTNIVNRWGELVSWASSYLSKKQTVLNIAKRISATYTEQAACFTHLSMAPVKSWLLEQMSLSLESTLTLFKVDVLLLLPCVVGNDTSGEDADLR